MGHWEQIGVENAKHRARKARLRAEGRIDWRCAGFWAFALAYCAVFWIAVGAQIWAFTSPLIRAILGHGQ